MSKAVIEYESARSPVPQEISGKVLNQFAHPKKDKIKTWVYREDNEKVVIVLHGSEARSEVRQTSESMTERTASALAQDCMVGSEPTKTLGDMRQTQLNSTDDVTITVEGENESLAEVYS